MTYKEQIQKGVRLYQVEGARFIAKNNGRGIIGDQMGLGKTISALSYFMRYPEKRPALIICPSSLKLNWKREVEKWTGEIVEVLSGEKPHPIGGSHWYVINYDILCYSENNELKGWWEKLSSFPFKAVIMDECHYIANVSNRTAGAVEIARSIPERILLSGTPIMNRSSEFFTALHIVAPEEFPSRQAYYQRYCAPRVEKGNWVYKGNSNTKELFQKASPFIIRREKKDVLKELPEKTQIVLTLPTADRKDYENATEELKNWYRKNENSSVTEMTYFNVLKQRAYLMKRPAVVDWIKNVIESGEKLVVFTYHRKAMADLKNEFPGISVSVQGGDSSASRQNAVDAFQNSEKIRLFIGQLKAAGEGLTLTAASTVAIVELGWNPAIHAQAEDRIHRFGQKKNCFVYYLLAEDSVETTIMEIIQKKHKTVSNIIDGEEKDFFGEVSTRLRDSL